METGIDYKDVRMSAPWSNCRITPNIGVESYSKPIIRIYEGTDTSALIDENVPILVPMPNSGKTKDMVDRMKHIFGNSPMYHTRLPFAMVGNDPDFIHELVKEGITQFAAAEENPHELISAVRTITRNIEHAKIIAGPVVGAKAVVELEDAGATHIIIGGGHSGFDAFNISAIMEAANARRKAMLIATATDQGVDTRANILKGIAAGAHYAIEFNENIPDEFFADVLKNTGAPDWNTFRTKVKLIKESK